MSAENPDFLKDKYALHNSEEVESAVTRTEIRSGKEVPRDPASRIQNYLERFTGILEREDPKHRERGVEALKHILHDKFVIKPEEIPEGYFENQRRIARELGHGDVDVPQEVRDQLTEVVITDQETTLDQWIDYLASPDATYPDWLKYYAVRSVLGMGAYDKEKHQFGKRSKGTTKPFPDLNREALAYVLDAIEKSNSETGYDFSTLSEEDRPQFEKLLTGENFSKLYAFAIENVTRATPEELESTELTWITYDQGSDGLSLARSLQGHGTGWCTAGETTAKAQLENGKFEKGIDQFGNPRAAIRWEGDRIAEVRGVAADQNLDPGATLAVEKKLGEYGNEGLIYQKKTADMKALTGIEQAVKADHPLNAKQLRFLYELDSRIEGFGYKRDPRIAELRSTRNPQEDMPTVFECSPDQIAHSATEITTETKAYVGPLVPGIFQMLPEGIEHIYTSFPENPIRQDTVEIGGTSRKELIRQLKEKDIRISDYARDMLNSADFTIIKETEVANLVRLTVESLGLQRGATTDEIYQRADELGLELCPAEVGPQYRLKYVSQPKGEFISIGMKKISDREALPNVFSLHHSGRRPHLNSKVAGSGVEWSPNDNLVFHRRHTIPFARSAGQESKEV